MSIVTLQFGQCGNQVGQALYDCIYDDIKSKTNCNKTISNEYIQESTNAWFHVKRNELEARAFLIDTEEKVTYLASKKKPYRFKNIISGSFGGSANNWAFGYASRSLLIAQNVMEKLRLEMEKCDSTTSLLNILSSSGGTGSGVGSRIIELVRDEYPSKFITNIIVLPFQKGDVVTQNYNTLLTLGKLYDICDNTILFENDKIFEISRKLVLKRDIKLSDLNHVIAQQLTSIMQPIKDVPYSQLISQISCHPSYKFLQVKTAPQLSPDHVSYEPVPNWSMLTNQVFRSSKMDLFVNSKLCKRIKHIGNLLMIRGNNNMREIDIKKFKDSALYVPWTPDTERVICCNQQRQLLNYQRFVSLVTNNNTICNTLDYILEDAWNLFTHGAYLHHYKKYNVDDEYFLQAFQKLENIVNDYKTL